MLRYPVPLKEDQIIPIKSPCEKKKKNNNSEHCAKLLYPQATKPQYTGNYVSCGRRSAEKK